MVTAAAAGRAISSLIEIVLKEEGAGKKLAATVLKSAGAIGTMGKTGIVIGAGAGAGIAAYGTYRAMKYAADCMHNRPKTAFNAASFMTGIAGAATPPPVNVILFGTAGMLGLLGSFSGTDEEVQAKNKVNAKKKKAAREESGDNTQGLMERLRSMYNWIKPSTAPSSES